MRKTCIMFIAASMASCNGFQPAEQDAPPPPDVTVLDEISSNMKEQEMAWNQGNINGFMKHYWNNEALRFIGSKGLTYGWKETRDNYIRSYPDVAAMGRLQFTNISMEQLSDSNAYVIGKWELFRTADTLSGHYSLLWKKIDGNWVIVADHSS